jgi:hypothetical protein
MIWQPGACRVDAHRRPGNVEVWALREDRFRITAPRHEQLVTGFDEAEQTADALAARLG